MNIEQINEIGRDMLEGLMMTLAEKQLIFNPCQVAFTVYYPKADYGKYLIFCSDIFPIINFLHPLRHFEDFNASYKTALKKDVDNLRKIPTQFHDLRDRYFKGLNFNDPTTLIKNSYQLLRNIDFEGPAVIGEFFKNCLSSNSSQQSDSLAFRTIVHHQKVNHRAWELGCLLERALFLGGIYPQYICTFFNFRGADYSQVFCISLFCKTYDFTEVEKQVLEFLKCQPAILMLEDIVEEYHAELDGSAISANPWLQHIITFGDILTEQENLLAASNNKLKGEIVAQLETVLKKFQAFSSSSLDGHSAQKSELVDEFIKKHSGVTGTTSWLDDLRTLNKQL